MHFPTKMSEWQYVAMLACFLNISGSSDYSQTAFVSVTIDVSSNSLSRSDSESLSGFEILQEHGSKRRNNILAWHSTHIKPALFTPPILKIVFNTLRSMALQMKRIWGRPMRKCKKCVRHRREKKILYSDSESEYLNWSVDDRENAEGYGDGYEGERGKTGRRVPSDYRTVATH